MMIGDLKSFFAQDTHGLATVEVGQTDIHDHQIDLPGLRSLHPLMPFSTAAASNSSYRDNCAVSASRKP
jgi:hypothetical protein